MCKHVSHHTPNVLCLCVEKVSLFYLYLVPCRKSYRKWDVPFRPRRSPTRSAHRLLIIIKKLLFSHETKEVNYICLHKGTFYEFTFLFSSQDYVTFGITLSFCLTLQGSIHTAQKFHRHFVLVVNKTQPTFCQREYLLQYVLNSCLFITK